MTCTSCGNTKAYIGLVIVECPNPDCHNFHRPTYEALSRELAKEHARIQPLVLDNRRWLSLHVAGPVNWQNEANYVGYRRLEIDASKSFSRTPIASSFRGPLGLHAVLNYRITNTERLEFPTCIGGEALITDVGFWDPNGLKAQMKVTHFFVSWGTTLYFDTGALTVEFPA